ncbi:hypothetical protein [Vaginisenegalia massiliensis]|uniref:hypothetical protein n=1 Tax=Vaginisenegalia massiliensis TaxID=2058294 RepID=UPI000F538C0F|nr:hypothetical protein [Vaginisenegalia massiliensis]
MVQQKLPYQLNVDPEMAKKIDRRLDRSGWFYLVVVIGLLFLVLYLMISLFRIPTNESIHQYSENQTRLEKRVEDLENQVKDYQQRLEKIEEKAN